MNTFTRIAPAMVVGMCLVSAINYAWTGDYKHALLWAGFTIANFAAQL